MQAPCAAVTHAQRPGAEPVLRALAPALKRLVGLALLSGSVRRTDWLDATGRSLLDLPVSGEETLMGWWRRQARELQATIRGSELDIRVLQVPHGPQPSAPERDVAVECDAARYRGTAGALRDLCCRFREDDFLLVAHAAQVLTEPLSVLVRDLADARADIAFCASRDGNPDGLYLVRCGALRGISPEGYCDLKEQALPRIAREHVVRIVRRAQPVGLPMRSPAEVIAALGHLHGGTSAAVSPLDRLEGEQQSHFAVCEDGATVDASACVCDSVVLNGAVVQSGAVVARSIVCPGAVVRRNSVVLESLVAAKARLQPARRDPSVHFSPQMPDLALPRARDFASGGAAA